MKKHLRGILLLLLFIMPIILGIGCIIGSIISLKNLLGLEELKNILHTIIQELKSINLDSVSTFNNIGQDLLKRSMGSLIAIITLIFGFFLLYLSLKSIIPLIIGIFGSFIKGPKFNFGCNILIIILMLKNMIYGFTFISSMLDLDFLVDILVVKQCKLYIGLFILWIMTNFLEIILCIIDILTKKKKQDIIEE